MKKTIFLSLVAGAIIFAGCGGGGGGSENPGGGGNPGGGNPGGGNPGGGNPGNNATIQITGNKWTVAGDDRQIAAVSTSALTYNEAEKYCTDKGAKIASARDLLSLDTSNTGLTVSWAKDQFYVVLGDPGQIGKAAQGALNPVACMTGTSVDKKHEVVEDQVTHVVTDNTTGLKWTPFQVINKGQEDSNTNQFTFPIKGAATGYLNADEYCQQLTVDGGGWSVPTAGELRSITYLDGTTQVVSLDNLTPTAIWTSTADASGRNLAIYLNEKSTEGYENGDAQGAKPDDNVTSANAYHYVTCVKNN